jgi:Tfp pilus assembly protein PilF
MLNQALKINPKCGEAYLSFANYYASKEEWKVAWKNLNKAIELGQKVHPKLMSLMNKNKP